MKATKKIPEGFTALTPFLTVRGGREAIEFYKKALGATEEGKVLSSDGRVEYAALKLGGATLMIGDELDDMPTRSPREVGSSSVCLALYVDDVDAAVKRATDAGAKVAAPVENQYYGDRAGTLIDPFGHVWWIGTHVEDVSHEELARRAKERGKKQT